MLSVPTTPDQDTDRLNEAIDDVEDALASLSLGVAASVAIDEQHFLRFEKVGPDWKLVVIGPNFNLPMRQASRALRIEATKHFDALLVALHEARRQVHNDVLCALDRALAFAKKVRG